MAPRNQPKRGQPPKDNARRETVAIRLTETEKQQLQEEADKLPTKPSLSSYLRWLCIDARATQ